VRAAGLGRFLARDLARHRGHLFLASLGVIFGVATFTFLLALAEGARAVAARLLPLDRLEVVPHRLEVNFLALRLGLGSETLDDAAIARLAALPGVAAVYPKMQLTVPAVLSGGEQLFGEEMYAELMADGIEPALVADDVGRGFEFRDLDDPADPRNARPEVRCGGDRDCPSGTYCGEALTVTGHACRAFVPVLASRQLVELYNGALRRAHDLPKLNPDALLGLSADMSLGASMFGASRGQVRRERLRLVGFSERAIPLGVTMPIGYVRRFNSAYGSPTAARRYHSAVVELGDRARAAGVAGAVRRMGYDVTDRGAEQLALMVTVLELVFGLVAGVIVALAAVHIMHVLLLLVLQRRREIGLMRAVGARRGDIRRLILGEAAVVGTTAGAVAIGLARAAAWAADLAARRWLPDLPFKPETFFAFPLPLVAGALGLAVGACVLGALVPAWRATRPDPAEVLSGA
jgi:putative ABC transport system permease protein